MSFLNKNGQVEGTQNNRTGNSSWGGFLKQAINSVETSLEKAAQDKHIEREPLTKSKPTPNVIKPSLDQDRLAARLAAAVSSANVPKKSQKGRKSKAGAGKKQLDKASATSAQQQSSNTNIDLKQQDALSIKSVSPRSSTEIAWDPLQSTDLVSEASSILDTDGASESANDIPTSPNTLEDSNNVTLDTSQDILNLATEIPLPKVETDEAIDNISADSEVVKTNEDFEEHPSDKVEDNKEKTILPKLTNEPEETNLDQKISLLETENESNPEEVKPERDESEHSTDITNIELQSEGVDMASTDTVSSKTSEHVDLPENSNDDMKTDPEESTIEMPQQVLLNYSTQEIDSTESKVNDDNTHENPVKQGANLDDEPHLKDVEEINNDAKKLDETTNEKLKQREAELTEKLRENATLSAVISTLKDRLRSAQENQQSTLKLNSVGNSALEKRIDNITKERDQVREKMTARQTEMQQVIAQKDQKISELFAEGERLSKQELKLSNMIKQLRTKGVESEKAFAELKKKFNDSQKEATALKAKSTKLAESEKKLSDACKLLRKQNEEHALKISKLESQLQESKEAQIDLQVALERAWDDLNKSRKVHNETIADLKKQNQENEDKIREELSKNLQESQTKYEKTIESLNQEISELQSTITSLNDDAGDNEDELRKEISALQMRLQSSEQRFQDLNAGYMNTTQPLLKQIEALENRHNTAQKHWEKIEERLTKELSEAKRLFDSSESKCKELRGSVDELSRTKTELEARLQTYEKDMVVAREHLQTEEEEHSKSRSRIQELSEKLESAQKAHDKYIERIKQDYEEQLSKQREELTRVSLDIVKDTDDDKPISNEDDKANDRSLRGSDSDVLSPTRLSFDSLTFPLSPIMASSSIEVLRAQIKNLESQVTSLQAQLQLTIKERDEISDELVQMTLDHKETKDTSRVNREEEDKTELEERYTSVLQELTERSEQVEELKSDIS
ncbi:hypothetical protein K7432_013447, partial [Basidiobolus ranarum]